MVLNWYSNIFQNFLYNKKCCVKIRDYLRVYRSIGLWFRAGLVPLSDFQTSVTSIICTSVVLWYVRSPLHIDKPMYCTPITDVIISLANDHVRMQHKQIIRYADKLLLLKPSSDISSAILWLSQVFGYTYCYLFKPWHPCYPKS